MFYLCKCMCTCVYVCVHTCECVTYEYVRMSVCACEYVLVCVCAYVCLYVCVCMYMFVRVCMCIYLCVCMCVCKHVCALVYLCISVCMCVYMRTCVLQLMPTLHLFLLNYSWRCDYHSFAHFQCCLSLINYWQCMPSVQDTCTNSRKGIFWTLYNFIKLPSPISSLGLLTWYYIKHVKLVLSLTTHQHCCVLVIFYAMLVRHCYPTQLL